MKEITGWTTTKEIEQFDSTGNLSITSSETWVDGKAIKVTMILKEIQECGCEDHYTCITCRFDRDIT